MKIFMKNRSQRIQLIKKIISEEVISSQDDLQLHLQEKGYDATQATLSRDLKSLHVMKASDSGSGYVYRLAANDTVNQQNVSEMSLMDFIAEGIVGIEFSANLGVIKTIPGYANSVAIMIDKANHNEILGTVAGDDTILLIMREGAGRNDVIQALKNTMPKLESKI
jgi:transcriptional regulator of arginine metabolism